MSPTSPKTFKHPTNGKTYKVTGTDISKVKVGDLIVGAFSETFKEVLSVGQDMLFVRTAGTIGESTVRRAHQNHYTVTELVTEKGYKRAYADEAVVPRHSLDATMAHGHYMMEGFIGWLEFTKVDGNVEDIKFIPYVNGQDF